MVHLQTQNEKRLCSFWKRDNSDQEHDPEWVDLKKTQILLS